jgi:23S rRNA (cytosine1962-C5)-methyltransferase
MSNQINILVTEPSSEYELLDTGDSEKLERFGEVILNRPDPQALWHKRFDEKYWEKAGAYFTRDSSGSEWTFRTTNMPPKKWQINFSGLKFWIKPTAFKHTGLFPEQSENWKWLENKIKNQLSSIKSEDSSGIAVLNLFGYTGGATLTCAKAGAKVVHIDSSKAAVTWARENAEISGLSEKPIRWIVEDARLFVEREIKRGRKYDGIIMDPPAFGHGPDGEIWKIEEHFMTLVDNCKNLLSDKPLFFLINGYSAGYSSISYENNLSDLKKIYGGNIEKGELTLKESGDSPRLLPAGIFARWSAK